MAVSSANANKQSLSNKDGWRHDLKEQKQTDYKTGLTRTCGASCRRLPWMKELQVALGSAWKTCLEFFPSACAVTI